MTFNTWKSNISGVKKEVTDKIADQLTNMAVDVVEQAQENANQRPPEHPQVQTGTMRRSITMSVDRAKLLAKVGIMKGKQGGDIALVYAPFIEFGDSRRPPYPFLFPAAEKITKQAGKYFHD